MNSICDTDNYPPQQAAELMRIIDHSDNESNNSDVFKVLRDFRKIQRARRSKNIRDYRHTTARLKDPNKSRQSLEDKQARERDIWNVLCHDITGSKPTNAVTFSSSDKYSRLREGLHLPLRVPIYTQKLGIFKDQFRLAEIEKNKQTEQ